jgi:outer membrane biosynthesis protein TonB
LKGTGTGGGGAPGSTTIGVGSLGTYGRGGNQAGYGTAVAKLKSRGESNISISVGNPIIMGSLSMEIIRQVIQSHRDQIKYCYSQELTRNPNLAGKVSVKFTISPKGFVTQATVSETSLNNAIVEQCIIQKIHTWKFPEPKGGGIVIVNYPFILRSQ